MSPIISKHNFSFNKNKLNTFLQDTEIWFIAKEVSEILGYSETSKMLRRLDDDEKQIVLRKENTFIPKRFFGNQGSLVLLNTRGLIKAITASRKVGEQFKIDLLNTLNIEHRYLVSRKEIKFIENLQEALKPFGFTIETQKKVGKYFVDIYVVEKNVVVEYDENNHSSYSVSQEKQREKTIIENLNCKIIRVSDSQSDSYNIGLVFQEIFEIE
jgi:very-short-patch-repair endonuclease